MDRTTPPLAVAPAGRRIGQRYSSPSTGANPPGR